MSTHGSFGPNGYEAVFGYDGQKLYFEDDGEVTTITVARGGKVTPIEVPNVDRTKLVAFLKEVIEFIEDPQGLFHK